MKTAMQSLITHLEMLNQRASTFPIDSLIDIIQTSYLNLEKGKIKDAYLEGWNNCSNNNKLTDEKYYNQTYNQNK